MAVACPPPSSFKGDDGTLLASLAVLVGCDDGRVEHLVVLTRSGGFTGYLDRLTIDESGHAVLRAARVPEASFELAPDDLANLRQALDQARLETLPRQPPKRDARGRAIRLDLSREVRACLRLFVAESLAPCHQPSRSTHPSTRGFLILIEGGISYFHQRGHLRGTTGQPIANSPLGPAGGQHRWCSEEPSESTAGAHRGDTHAEMAGQSRTLMSP